MIDFHSHILPQMDDGSQSVEESLEMLCEEKKQGVEAIVATPHFYSGQERMTDFLNRRRESAEMLLNSMRGQDMPTLYLGAETAYYYGISRSSEIFQLCIGGTDHILIEMPFVKWTDSMVNEIIQMNESLGYRPILAHVERYDGLVSNKLLEQLCDSGVILQCNATFFSERRTTRKALKMFRKEMIGVLGTDTHNMTTRKPNLKNGYDILINKFGENEMSLFDDFGKFILSDAVTAEEYLRKADN